MDRRRARLLLGLPPIYEVADVDVAFRRKAALAHPDRGGDAEDFKALVESRRALLSTPSERAARIRVVDKRRLQRLREALRRHRAKKVRRVI